jgi:hypothetical protein
VVADPFAVPLAGVVQCPHSDHGGLRSSRLWPHPDSTTPSTNPPSTKRRRETVLSSLEYICIQHQGQRRPRFRSGRKKPHSPGGPGLHFRCFPNEDATDWPDTVVSHLPPWDVFSSCVEAAGPRRPVPSASAGGKHRQEAPSAWELALLLGAGLSQAISASRSIGANI